MSKTKLRLERESRIKKRLEVFKKRKGYKFFLTHIEFPENQKAKSKEILNQKILGVQKHLIAIEKELKYIKKFVSCYWDQNKITAIYLLLGKSFFDLKSILVLLRNGHCYQSFDLARSAIEAIDLMFLFQEEEQNQELKKWFKGEIIRNKKARKALKKTLNANLGSKAVLPIYSAKTDIYDTYSLFTHSSYAALLDLIDVFREDIDYKMLSGYYYGLKYFEDIVHNLIFNMLLAIKSVHLDLLSKETRLVEIDKLLGELDHMKATSEEIANITKEHYS